MRTLDTGTLDSAARHYAGLFLSNRKPFDRDWVIQQFFNFTFKDEFEYLLKAMKGELGSRATVDLEERAKAAFSPRDDRDFKGLLEKKLAVDPEGKHIPGRIGTTQLGNRVVGKRLNHRGSPKNVNRTAPSKRAQHADFQRSRSPDVRCLRGQPR
jgi:hypothetical protein